MKVTGNIIHFEHITQSCGKDKQPAIIVVQIDGEWELWFSQADTPSTQEIILCIKEVQEYYRRDFPDKEFTILSSGPTARFECVPI